MVAGDPDAQVFQYELLLESRRRPELRPLADELQRTYRTAARSGLSRLGFDDPDLADLVYAALDGLVLEQLTVGSREEELKRLDTLRRVLTKLRDVDPVADPDADERGALR